MEAACHSHSGRTLGSIQGQVRGMDPCFFRSWFTHSDQAFTLRKKDNSATENTHSACLLTGLKAVDTGELNIQRGTFSFFFKNEATC